MKRGYTHMKCGLIGEKLGHSFSSLIHNRLSDYSFTLREIERDKLGEFLNSNELDAFCVTIPYKKEVIPYLDYISPEARAIGAVNVIVRDGNKLYGYNSDYFGFEYTLNSSGVEVANKKAVVFGNGGASLTVCTVLRDKNIAELTVIGRNDNTPENISKHSDAQIIVNATPVGMYPHNGTAPVDLSLFPKCEAVFDLVYNPARTELLLQAQERGILAVGGLPMLVAQAARGFEYFTGDSYEDGCIEETINYISQSTQNVILVGMPGCGKSTVGKLLAKSLGREFFDADDEFTKTHGITPADAINTLGEEKFRLMENEILRQLGKKSCAVIATGGGAVTREYNYSPLHQNGVIVFLERAIDKLPVSGRPLSQGRNLAELYESRVDAYLRFSDIRVESTEIPQMTANAIIQKLSKYDYTCIFKSCGGK